MNVLWFFDWKLPFFHDFAFTSYQTLTTFTYSGSYFPIIWSMHDFLRFKYFHWTTVSITQSLISLNAFRTTVFMRHEVYDLLHFPVNIIYRNERWFIMKFKHGQREIRNGIMAANGSGAAASINHVYSREASIIMILQETLGFFRASIFYWRANGPLAFAINNIA